MIDGMADHEVVHLRNHRLFDLAAYLTLAVTVGVTFLVQPNPPVRAFVTVVAVAIGLVYRFGYYRIDTPGPRTAYFTIQGLLITGLVLIPGTSDVYGLLFFIVSIQAVLTLPGRAAAAWITLFYVIDSGSALWGRGAIGIVNVLFNAAVFFLTFVFANALRQAEIARRQNEELIEEVRRAQRKIHDMAIAQERNRLARELHDSVKQQVFALSMQLSAARVLLDRDLHGARSHVAEAEQLAQQAGAELVLLIEELRPIGLTDRGLAEALRAYTTDWARRSGIRVDLRVEDGQRIAPATEQAFLRVVQEALANVARHSGASDVTISLWDAGEALVLTIADNGRGFDLATSSQGVGLASMRERVETLGGSFLIASTPGAGTAITARSTA